MFYVIHMEWKLVAGKYFTYKDRNMTKSLKFPNINDAGWKIKK
jgi:hypothetical protein